MEENNKLFDEFTRARKELVRRHGHHWCVTNKPGIPFWLPLVLGGSVFFLRSLKFACVVVGVTGCYALLVEYAKRQHAQEVRRLKWALNAADAIVYRDTPNPELELKLFLACFKDEEPTVIFTPWF